jgi:hypothetical protein
MALSAGPDPAPFFESRRRLTYFLDAPVRYLSLCQRWLTPFPSGRLVTVVGDAIDVSEGAEYAKGGKVESPSREEVRKAHARYCDALLKLIEETKAEAGYPTQRTVLV